MEKTTGLVQYERPDDFRPHLRDDLFEEVIVELFMTADTNCDGYIDGTDFYNVRKPQNSLDEYLAITLLEFTEVFFRMWH